jgi:hypothetical protein
MYNITITKEEEEYANAIGDFVGLLCKDDPTIQDLEESLRTYKTTSSSDVLRAYYKRKTQILRDYIKKYSEGELTDERSRH